MLVLIKIAYYRDKQLIWFEGNFEKATFSRYVDSFIWRYWVHWATCTPYDKERP